MFFWHFVPPRSYYKYRVNIGDWAIFLSTMCHDMVSYCPECDMTCLLRILMLHSKYSMIPRSQKIVVFDATIFESEVSYCAWSAGAAVHKATMQ